MDRRRAVAPGEKVEMKGIIVPFGVAVFPVLSKGGRAGG